jgi:predicted transcriptional regulator
MNSGEINAIVVTENDKTVGLFTEKDVARCWN